MKYRHSAFVALVACSPALHAQSSGARDLAMGGTGVASSKPYTALFVNPARMTDHSEDFDFGLVLPYIDVAARAEESLVDDAEAFQDTLDELQALLDGGDLVGANALRPELAAQLQALDNRRVDVAANGGIGIVLPFEAVKVGIGTRAFVDAQVITDVDAADIALINNPTSTSADLDNLQSEVFVAAAGVSEFALSLAKEFEVGDTSFSLGITPKLQQIDTFNYAVSVADFDEDDAFDDFDNEQFRNDDSGFNLDLGAAMSFTEHLSGGLTLRNLVSNEYETVVTSGRTFTYNVEPQLTAGIAFEAAKFTATADLDLNPVTRFSGAGDSQFARVGLEYDAFGWLQLRGGYSVDLEDTQPELLHAGLGFSPFEVVHVDVVGLLGDDSAGAGLQLSLTF